MKSNFYHAFFLVVVVVMATAIFFSSCKSSSTIAEKVVPITEKQIDSCNIYDSIMRDSVRIEKEFVYVREKGDTVFVEKEVYIYDKVYEAKKHNTDSIAIEYKEVPVKVKVKEIEYVDKKPNFIESATMFVGGIVIIGFLIYAIGCVVVKYIIKK